MSMPLFPAPKEITRQEGTFRFGKETRMRVAPASFSSDQAALLRSLWAQHCFLCGSLDIVEDEKLCAYAACIGRSGTQALAQGDEYAIHVTAEGVSIKGQNAESMLHAMFTLLQAIDPVCLDEGKEAFSIACMEVRDRPSLGIRGIHLCIFPETTPLLLEKAIRMAGFMKMNLVVLEFWGVYPYKALPELHWAGHAFDLHALGDLISLARALGMEVTPMINHLGHATASRASVGRHVVLDQNPRRALLFEPDGWTWCLSNPDTHRILRECRAELMDFFGPGNYFHLGCDETYSFATCPACASKDKPAMLADYLNGLAEELGRVGRRGIIWGDQFLETAAWPRPYIATSGAEQRMHEALDLLDRRLIINDWQYDIQTQQLASAEHFMKKGFEVWACPWDANGNNEALAGAMEKMRGQGVLATTWHHLPSMLPLMPTVCGAAWNGASYQALKWQRIPAMAAMRKVMPPAGGFERAGYMPHETDAKAIRTIG